MIVGHFSGRNQVEQEGRNDELTGNSLYHCDSGIVGRCLLVGPGLL